MAKVDTQSIPSETRIVYKRALQISTTRKGSTYVRTRYPWRLPQMQAGGPDVKPDQVVQRDRFIYAYEHYALLDATAKARWAAANPEYHSFLFGYNFFMLEGLLGGGPTQYPQMIKTIQVVKEEVPTTGTKTFVISAVDPAKTVVLIQGSARKVPIVVRGSASIATGGTDQAHGGTIDPDKCTVQLLGASYNRWVAENESYAWTVYPYVFALTSSNIHIKFALTPIAAAVIGWEITEHVEGVVYPVQVSIAAEAIVLDWAEVPDAAADVSITVVEYL